MSPPFGLLKKLAMPLVKKLGKKAVDGVERKLASATGGREIKAPCALAIAKWGILGIVILVGICLIGIKLGAWTIQEFVDLVGPLLKSVLE